MKYYLLVFVLLLAFPYTGFAGLVHLDVELLLGGKRASGGGVSVLRGAECFIVTDHHIVKSAKNIVVIDKKGTRAKAKLHKAYDGFDLAVLRTDKVAGFICEQDWQDGANLENILDSATKIISKRQRDGSSSRSYLCYTGINDTQIIFRPETGNDTFLPGDSGSAVFVGKKMVGLTQSIEGGDKANKVNVLRQDRIHELVKDVVLESKTKTLYLKPVYMRNREFRAGTLTAHEYLKMSTDYNIKQLVDEKRRKANDALVVPSGGDYLLQVDILDVVQARKKNPYYMGDQIKRATSKLGGDWGSILGKVASSVQGDDERYISEYKVEMELQFIDAADNSYFHLAREKVSLPNQNARTGQSEAITIALKKAIPQIFYKAGL